MIAKIKGIGIRQLGTMVAVDFFENQAAVEANTPEDTQQFYLDQVLYEADIIAATQVEVSNYLQRKAEAEILAGQVIPPLP
jgi:hypothetical protein